MTSATGQLTRPYVSEATTDEDCLYYDDASDCGCTDARPHCVASTFHASSVLDVGGRSLGVPPFDT